MLKNHDAEKPREGGSSHQKSDENRPPENASATFFFFGKTAAPVGTKFAAVAQESDMHGKVEKSIKIIEGGSSKFYWIKRKRKVFSVNKLE